MSLALATFSKLSKENCPKKCPGRDPYFLCFLVEFAIFPCLSDKLGEICPPLTRQIFGHFYLVKVPNRAKKLQEIFRHDHQKFMRSSRVKSRVACANPLGSHELRNNNLAETNRASPCDRTAPHPSARRLH